jgi:hypothetical protein
MTFGTMTITRLHARFAQIERAYKAALGNRDPASVNVRVLLPKIFARARHLGRGEVLTISASARESVQSSRSRVIRVGARTAARR